MSVAAQLQPREPSPLASARLRRKLTVDEAARRAGITTEQVEWLEDGRVYRFPTADDALLATVLYATALGIDADEARALARLPIAPKPARYARSRIAGAAAAVALLAALAVALVAGFGGDAKKRARATTLPTWKLSVDVLNGGGDIYYTRTLASKIGMDAAGTLQEYQARNNNSSLDGLPGLRAARKDQGERMWYRDTQVKLRKANGPWQMVLVALLSTLITAITMNVMR